MKPCWLFRKSCGTGRLNALLPPRQITKSVKSRGRDRLAVVKRDLSVVRFSYMTTVLSQKGQIVLPIPVRQQLHLEPGDDFEVAVEDDDTITLRRISHPANCGLVDLLLACPGAFEVPPRDKDDTAPPTL
jgi:AbrB family looped-hinge helix DNA binding protein